MLETIAGFTALIGTVCAIANLRSVAAACMVVFKDADSTQSGIGGVHIALRSDNIRQRANIINILSIQHRV